MKNLFTFFVLVALLVFLLNSSFLFAQARLVIGNSSAVYMKMNGGTSGTPIYIVIDNSATNAITRTTGWIISEGQYNYVKWNCGTVTGNYLYPFGYSTSDYLPLTINKTTAGASDVSASTWGTAASDNLPWAGISDAGTVAAVGNMYDATLGQDGSDEAVIDRWWDIYGSAATTANVTFSYRGAENTMSPGYQTAELASQHWTGSVWNDGKGGISGSYTSTGTNGVTSGIGSVTASSLTEFSPHVLVAKQAPLPVEWLSISAECEKGHTKIKWSTATEQNADYFTVERSFDGRNFSSITTVQAAGNSSTIKHYFVIDKDANSGTTFYQVKETDFNGSFSYSKLITALGCSKDYIHIYETDGAATVSIGASEEGEYTIELYDALGQTLMNQQKNVAIGDNNFKLFPSNISSSVYVVKVYNRSYSVIKKVLLSR